LETTVAQTNATPVPLREIPPEELILTLLDGAPTKLWKFEKYLPSGEKVVSTIRLKVLRGEENLQALAASQEVAKEKGELGGYGDIYKEAQAYEVLQRALCHVNKRTRGDGTEYYPPVFTDSRQLRMSFNESEIAVLLNCYDITKAEYSALEGLEEREAELWIARFSDPLQGPLSLSQLDSRHWPACIYLLAGIARDCYREAGRPLPSLLGSSESSPENSAQDTGSSTAPPSASSTDASEQVQVTAGELLTREQARALARKKPAK
jgi:hypothetical protein